MGRGAWQATVHGIARVGHDLETNHHHHQVNQNGKQNNYLFLSKTLLFQNALRLCLYIVFSSVWISQSVMSDSL